MSTPWNPDSEAAAPVAALPETINPALAARAGAAYSGRLSAAERERLLLEQLPHVRSIARRIHERLPAQVELEDLVQAGVVGLIDALHKYDPSRNAQLATYARFRVRGAILDSLRQLDWSPRELRQRSRAMKAMEAQLAQQLGRGPSEAELAAGLGLELEALQALRAELDSLEPAPTPGPNAEGQETSPLDLLATPAPGPFELCQQAETKAHLAALIEELPERDRQLLSLYYFEELTMKEVGAVLGIGESRVCQLHALLLAKLKARLGGQGAAAAGLGA